MRASETVIFCQNAAAGTYGIPAQAGAQGAGGLMGGRYLFLLKCTGTPSAQIQAQDPAGNWINVGSAFVTASGGSVEVALPPGNVQVVISTSTANYATLSRIPND